VDPSAQDVKTEIGKKWKNGEYDRSTARVNGKTVVRTQGGTKKKKKAQGIGPNLGQPFTTGDLSGGKKKKKREALGSKTLVEQKKRASGLAGGNLRS